MTTETSRSSDTSASRCSDLAAWEAFATGVLGVWRWARAGEGALLPALRRPRPPLLRRAGPGRRPRLLRLAGRRRGGLRRADRAPARGRRRRASWAPRTRRSAAGMYAAHAASATPAASPTGDVPRSRARDRAVRLATVVRRASSPATTGLGHVVVSAADQARTRAFYCDLLGFRLSDRIAGRDPRLPRRHASSSTPTGATTPSPSAGPAATRTSTTSCSRCARWTTSASPSTAPSRAGVRIMQTLGRHPNDRMFSFYAKTPSGFQFEYRLGRARRWTTRPGSRRSTYDHISEWGHQPPGILAPKPRRAHTDDGRRRMSAGRFPRGSSPTSATGCASTTTRPGSGPVVLFLHGSGPGASG